MAIFPVIMCGGSGTRLWPASRPWRPKQFVPLAGLMSSFQDTVLRVSGLEGAARPLIVAGIAHQPTILSQLSELGVTADLLLEPEARDSAAAMAAAALWIEALDPEGVAVVVSADHQVDDAHAFRSAINEAVLGARTGRIVTLGMQPTSASSAFGYIQPAGGQGVQPILSFVEKPDTVTAQAYLDQGFLWNSGNFVVLASVLVEELATHAPAILDAVRLGLKFAQSEGEVQVLGEGFRKAPKISIDYAVMEQTNRASVLPAAFQWSDLGAWDAVLAASPLDDDGNATSGDTLLIGSSNSVVRTGHGQRVVAIGVNNLAIIADGDSVLVCHLNHSQEVKTAVDRLKAQGPIRSDFASLTEARAWYDRWLKTSALPLWWTLGADHIQGGFIEALSINGEPRPAPRRGRVQGRQVYAFVTAGRLGWAGPWRQAARFGLDYVFEKFQRPDGLIRHLLTEDGQPLEDCATVYDQAFALLGMAKLHQAGGYDRDLMLEAHRIRTGLDALRHDKGGYKETVGAPFQSNCHMHLLEASLAWSEAGDQSWDALADEIADMALTRFIDPNGGFLREFFDTDWQPAPYEDGARVEPGHQFEWAWLLARWSHLRNRPDALSAAKNLFACGKHGVDAKGIACDALKDDLTVLDANARLWPQTEYLKAALILNEPEDALKAANGLMLYLQTPVSGVWQDSLNAEGNFQGDLAPASSFYHIICAIDELAKNGASPSAYHNRRYGP